MLMLLTHAGMEGSAPQLTAPGTVCSNLQGSKSRCEGVLPQREQPGRTPDNCTESLSSLLCSTRRLLHVETS